jgi:diacylglycerol kinase family enzyme
MRYVCKGETVKVDVTKVLIDVENEEEIGGEAEDHVRYSIVNSCLCLSANVNKNAGRWKPMFGSESYSIQTVLELIKRRQETFDIEIDDDVKLKDVTT